MISVCKQRFFNLTVTICTQQIIKLIDLAHEIPGVKVAQKTWHKLLDDAPTKEAVADDTANSNSLTHSPSQSWSKETKSFGFEESVSNSTADQDSAKMPEMWIMTVDPGRRSTVMELASETTVATSSLNTTGTKSNNTGNGEDNHVDVVETNQPSETASTMSAIESGDADESMNMMKPGTEAWGLIHSRYAQKHTENQRYELQPVDIRSLDEITKTMKDLSIIQHQAELEEKAGNHQQRRRELSMAAQDYDAKHGDVNSPQVAYQEDDNLRLQNENIQEYKELHEQIQAHFSSTLEILDQKFKQELDRMEGRIQRNTALYIQCAINL